MKEFRGKVAVVTGAASGIGRALAEIFGKQGMKVVLADIESDALARTSQELAKDGIETLAVQTDVTQPDALSALAEQTLDSFGAAHILCNNAGVFAGGLSWEAPLSDYEWVFGVNVLGRPARDPRVRADHARAGLRVSHREYGIDGGRDQFAARGFVLHEQARRDVTERDALPRTHGPRIEDRRVGALPGAGRDADWGFGAQSTRVPAAKRGGGRGPGKP